MTEFSGSIRILGQTWTVYLTDEDRILGDDRAVMIHPTLEIYLASDVSPEQWPELLFHEIGEAVMKDLDIEFADKNHKDYNTFMHILWATLQDMGAIDLSGLLRRL